jgi:hypothetical protein
MSFYVLKIKENYCFHTRIPQVRQHYFPYQEIKCSLRTENINHIEKLFNMWSSKAENVFVVGRKGLSRFKRIVALDFFQYTVDFVRF